MDSSSSGIVTSRSGSETTSTTTIARATAPPQPTQCIQITNPVFFIDFEGGYLRCLNLLRPCNITTYEALIADSFFEPLTTDALVKEFQDRWGCPGSDFNLRYFNSVLLGYFLQTAQASVRDSFKCPANPPNVKMVCRSTCLAYAESSTVNLNNTAVCKPVSELTSAQKQIRKSFAQLRENCNLLPETDCLPFISADRGTCGFSIPNQAAVYCRRGGLGELRNDNCCLQLTGRFAEAMAKDPTGRGSFTVTPVPAAVVGGAGSSGSGSVPVVAIVVPLVLVVLAAAVAAVFLVLRRDRRSKKEEALEASFRSPGGNASAERLTLAGTSYSLVPASVPTSTDQQASRLDEADASPNVFGPDVTHWTAGQVTRWLLSSGFDQSIANALRAGNVDGRMLLILNDESLAMLGVEAPGVRTMLLAAADALRTGDSPAASRHGTMQRAPLPEYSA
ncbi:hypothetical protein HDU96_009512 [Phlyctochytrium bullatum]|nr:hypothetical protein HDU96_009512 [Phlyctochytrium bullatum]